MLEASSSRMFLLDNTICSQTCNVAYRAYWCLVKVWARACSHYYPSQLKTASEPQTLTTGAAASCSKCPSPCTAEAGGFLVKQKARQQKPRQTKPAPPEQHDAPEGDGESGTPNKDAPGGDAGDSGIHSRTCSQADRPVAGSALAAGDMPLPWLLLWGIWARVLCHTPCALPSSATCWAHRCNLHPACLPLPELLYSME